MHVSVVNVKFDFILEASHNLKRMVGKERKYS